MSSIIYTAKPTISGRPDGIAFAAKGIKGFTPTTLSDLHISGFPTEIDVAYENYKHNISCFIAATNNNTRIPVSVLGTKLEKRENETLFTLAPMSFKPIPDIPMKDDDIIRFVKRYEDYKVEVEKAGKTTFFTFHKPTPEIALKLAPMHDTNFRTHPEHITPQDVITTIFLDQLAKAFLATQTYASFSTKEEVEVDMEDGGKEKKREVVTTESCRFNDENVEITVNFATSEEYTSLLNAAKVIRDEALELEDNEPSLCLRQESVTALDTILIDHHDMPSATVTSRDIVLIAKPSPLPFSHNLGAPKDVPRSPGNLFPYFDRMLLSDRVSLKRIVFQHFTRNLGDTFEEITEQRAKLRKSLDDFVNSTFSIIYQHLFTGIQLALQTQTRLFVIRERGEYLGFCLLGYRYTLSMQHLVYTPATYQQLQKSISTISSHTSSLELIVEKLSTLKFKHCEEPLVVKASDITYAGELALEIRSREVDQKWYEKELVDLLGKLRFGQSYRPTTAQDIVKVLGGYADSPQQFPPPTTPIFLPSRAALLSDPLYCHLACFGPEAISPLNSRGVSEGIPKRVAPTAGGEEALAIPKNQYLPKVILARKPVAVATEDWREVMKKKAFTQDINERAQQSRCLVFVKRQAEMVLDIMSRLVHETVDPSKSQASKRKRPEGDDKGAGPSKRVMTLEDLF